MSDGEHRGQKIVAADGILPEFRKVNSGMGEKRKVKYGLVLE